MNTNELAMVLPRQDVLGLIDQIRGLTHEIPQDETLRRHLREAIQELSLVLETPLETVRRISFSVKKNLCTKAWVILLICRLASSDQHC